MMFSLPNTFAQNVCHTILAADEPSSDPCDVFYDEGPVMNGHCHPENNDLFIIRVFIHLVTLDNGTGGQGLTAINTALNTMIRDYAPYNITFSFIGLDSVKNTNFYNYEKSKFNSLISTQSHAGAIDLYFLPPGIYGAAEASISGKALVLGGGNTINGTPLTGTSLISHEMGHCLSLLHTFWPLIPELEYLDDRFCGPGLFQTDQCKCGDFVSDTAYDPMTFCFTYYNPANGNCTYLDTVPHVELQPICIIDSLPAIEPGNAPFINQYHPGISPPINNIMSYSPWECLNHFTEGQARRMKNYMLLCQPFQQLIEHNTIRIAGGLSIRYDISLAGCLPDIVIEPGAKLTIKEDLHFLTASKIEVKQRGRLTVDGAKLSGCNDQYWQGIQVFGSPDSTQLPYTKQGYALLANGAAIKKATHPIKVYDGGIVQAYSSDFLDCGEISIYDYNHQNYSRFQNCSFRRGEQYEIPFYVPQMYLQRVRGIIISQSLFESIQPEGVQFNGDAIVGADASFSVRNGTIIDGYYRGITGYSWGTDPLATFRVETCTLKKNFIGVASWGIDHIVIKDNFFQHIGAHPADGVKRGLELWNCTGFVVKNNHFFGSANGSGRIGLSIGVLAANTGGEINEIKKNNFEYVNVANQAEFKNAGELPSDGLQYLCNTNTTTNFDFYVWDEGVAQIQGGGNATRNAFSHPNTTAPNINYNDFNNQSNNIIDYYHLALPIEIPENGYYLNVNPMETTIATDCEEDIEDDTKLTTSEELQLSQAFNEAKTAYHDQRQDYQLLPPGDPLAQDIKIKMAKSKGAMHTIANRIIRSELSDTISLDLSKIRTWLANKESLESGYRIVETYLKEGNTLSAYIVRDSILLKHQFTDDLLENYNAFVQWTALKIALLEHGKSILGLDPITVSQLQTIAETNTGLAATQTQGLLNLAYYYSYELNPKIPVSSQALLSPPVNETILKGKTHDYSLVTAPNPAKEFVTFRYVLPENADRSRIVVKDINGREIARFQITDTSGSIQWPTNHLPAGIYFYFMQYSSNKASPRKLILVK